MAHMMIQIKDTPISVAESTPQRKGLDTLTQPAGRAESPGFGSHSFQPVRQPCHSEFRRPSLESQAPGPSGTAPRARRSRRYFSRVAHDALHRFRTGRSTRRVAARSQLAGLCSPAGRGPGEFCAAGSAAAANAGACSGDEYHFPVQPHAPPPRPVGAQPSWAPPDADPGRTAHRRSSFARTALKPTRS